MNNNGRFKVRAAALACALLGTGIASADGGALTFSGFGTLGVVHSDDRDSDFRGSIVHPNGVGKSKAVTTGVDSKLN